MGFMQVFPYILAVVIGYACGCVNPASMMAKKRGFDIRDRGSNNPGTSNAVITMGWKAGVLVGAIDILKAAIPVLIIRFVFPDAPIAMAVAGAASVLGHIFPVTMRFKGGKGFAPFLGMCLGLDWRIFLCIVVGIAVITIATDYIALATLFTVVFEPIIMGILRHSWIVAAVIAVASLVIILKHIENIKRILTGKEIGLRSTMGKKGKA